MKKLLSVAITALATAAMAETSTPIGVTVVPTTKQNTIVAVPFTALADGGNVAAKDIVKVANLPAGTFMYAFNGTGYTAWTIADGAWTPLANASAAGISAGDEDAKFAKGSAIWIVLPEKPQSSQNICIYGQWEASVSTTIAVGMNLVANPLLTTASFTFENATDGDVITVPNDNAAPTVYTYKNSKWIHMEQGEGPLPSVVEGAPSLGAGCGFWYNAKTAGTMTWGAPQDS